MRHHAEQEHNPESLAPEKVPTLLGIKPERAEDGEGKYWAGKIIEAPGSKEIYERNERYIKTLDKELAEQFPETKDLFRDSINWFDLSSPKTEAALALVEKRIEALPVEQKRLAQMMLGRFEDKRSILSFLTISGRKLRGRDLFHLATLLGGDPERAHDLDNVCAILHDKKILVLGDDIGTFSEVLRTLGADAYGLEGNKERCLAARSGFLAEDLKPQDQVIEGNIGDILTGEKDTTKKLQTAGPFDVIFSTNTFVDTGYSGIEGMTSRGREIINAGSKNPGVEYFIKSDALLKDGGFQFHDRVDNYVVGVEHFPDEYNYMNEDREKMPLQLFGRGLAENPEAQHILQSGFVQFPMRDEYAVFSKKGTIEKLAGIPGIIATEGRNY